ncbi:TPA: EamA family transporter [Flavobacterium psychrophilum]|uniref:EamA family transporter n=2 Tax=Flavobacterium psychrophilum TaxID=96345 RepID=UPI000B7C4D01|nr:EamA family transporter [Flavobacterium psychrophilum]SNB97882.1 putative permease YojE [Flavobacterium psychrophilum]GEJ31776.1 permease [Flavobacterium psychrophilum]GEJ36985.1 permease [Flavobacterium psychrophilum]GEJ39418.1 permease [Flavobacterium psychrophilum]GEJ39957.1 permease [Flavobacterium psychrophilum]
MQINKYYLSALSSFVIWGFFSLVLKPLHNYPSLDILFYRVFYATGLSIIINLLFRKEKLKNDWKSYLTLEKKEKIKTLLLTVLGGFLLTFNWFMFIYAINHVSLKSASFAYLICPIVTTILAYFILKEKLSKWQWFSVFLCIISCAMLSYGDLKGLIYSLVIAISFALYLISQRENNKFDRFVVLTVQLLIASMVLLPFFPVYRGEIPTEPIFYILMTIIVVLFTIIPLFLNLFALRGITSSAVGILMYSNPMINLLLAIFYFKEEINSVQIGSYLLILFSIIIFNEKLLRVSKD